MNDDLMFTDREAWEKEYIKAHFCSHKWAEVSPESKDDTQVCIKCGLRG